MPITPITFSEFFAICIRSCSGFDLRMLNNMNNDASISIIVPYFFGVSTSIVEIEDEKPQWQAVSIEVRRWAFLDLEGRVKGGFNLVATKTIGEEEEEDERRTNKIL
ncbi:hypothetical protein YC2023_025027 [Brassica napus]